MEFAVILAAVFALAHGGRSLHPAMECSNLHDDQSLLSSILHVLGYNETCVAASLDYCSSAQEDGDLQIEKAGEAQQNNMVENKSECRPRSCKDLLDFGDSGSGLRQVYPYYGRPNDNVTVYCEQEIDGGGWTVFQRRVNNTIRENFSRRWREYQAGFGDVENEFWIGLEALHALTKTEQELRVDLEDFEGSHRWAKYGTFRVGSEDTNYRLTIGSYSGDAGDDMSKSNGGRFSTLDADHNTYSRDHCGRVYQGGWWYKNCGWVNLNGYQHVGSFTASFGEGIIWHQFRGWKYSLRRTTMMGRPAP